MKITLDRQEIASILITWGKQQYKTHNVSVERVNADGSMDMMVTMSDNDYNNAKSDATAEAIARLRERVPEDIETYSGPSLDNAGNTEFL